MSGAVAALALLRAGDRIEAIRRLQAEPDAGTAAALALLVDGRFDDWAQALLEAGIDMLGARAELTAAGGVIADMDAAHGQTATLGPISGPYRAEEGLAGVPQPPGAPAASGGASGGASAAAETRAGETTMVRRAAK